MINRERKEARREAKEGRISARAESISFRRTYARLRYGNVSATLTMIDRFIEMSAEPPRLRSHRETIRLRIAEIPARPF